MTLAQDLDYLLQELRVEEVPMAMEAKWRLLRGTLNRRIPLPVSADFIEVQDRVLAQWRQEEPIATLADCTATDTAGIWLWQGDITRLQVDAIVNAANSVMLGCFEPNHHCIDNQIHTFAGVQLRLACAEIKKSRQGRPLKVGEAVITQAYNLPSRHIIHTVGPRIQVRDTAQPLKVSAMMQDLLAKCYVECLQLAEQNGCHTLAFCGISTGEFRFPADLACQIAVATVQNYLAQRASDLQVIFVTYSEHDTQLYRQALLKGESV